MKRRTNIAAPAAPFRKLAAAIALASLTGTLVLTAPIAAVAAAETITPGSVGQADGTAKLIFEQSAHHFIYTAPEGVLISPPNTAYPCISLDTNETIVQGEFASGIKCSQTTNYNTNFGSYTFKYLVGADQVPGSTISALQYSLIKLSGEVANSGSLDLPVAGLNKPTFSAPDPGALLNTSPPVISGSADDLPGTTQLVTLTDANGNTIGTSPVEDGVWSVTPADRLPDGYTQLTAVTSLNGASSPSATIDFTIDTTAPAKPVITGPADGTATNTSPPTFTGSGENGSTIQLEDSDGNIICETIVNGETWTCTPENALEDGPQTITPIAKDPAGNTTSGDSITITVDTTAPVPATPANPVCVQSPNGTVTCSGSGVTGDDVVVRTPGGDEVCRTTVPASGLWSCTSDSPVDTDEVIVTFTTPDGTDRESVVVKVQAHNAGSEDQHAGLAFTGGDATPVIVAASAALALILLGGVFLLRRRKKEDQAA